jgi:hypothetical protein
MTKAACTGLIALTLLFGITRSSEARVRVFIGPAWGGPVLVAPYPYEVTPPPVIVSPPPPSGYVEQPPPPVSFYCENPQGYYPQVAQCPGGWKTIPPPPAG